MRLMYCKVDGIGRKPANISLGRKSSLLDTNRRAGSRSPTTRIYRQAKKKIANILAPLSPGSFAGQFNHPANACGERLGGEGLGVRGLLCAPLTDRLFNPRTNVTWSRTPGSSQLYTQDHEDTHHRSIMPQCFAGKVVFAIHLND